MTISQIALPDSSPRFRRVGFSIFFAVLPLLVTSLFWRILPEGARANESADFHSYYAPVARNLLANHGLLTREGKLAIEYPPGQVFALAATFATAHEFNISEEAALRLFELICVTWSCVAIALLARRVWGDRGAIIAAVAWCTYPLSLWLAKQPNSELLFMALLITSLALLIPASFDQRQGLHRWLGAGLAIGGAMLVRPIALFVPGILGIAVLVRARALPINRRILGCAVFAVGVATVVMPWEVWVYRQTGAVVPLSAGGASAMKDGFTFGVDNRDYRQGIDVPEDVAAFMRPIRAQVMRTSGDVFAAVMRQARAHPVAAVKLVGIKLARAWYATDSERMERYIIFIQLVYIVVLLEATRRAWKLGGERRELAITLWAIVCCFWAMNLLSLPIARYMTPAIGLLFLLVPSLWPSLGMEAHRTLMAVRD